MNKIPLLLVLMLCIVPCGAGAASEQYKGSDVCAKCHKKVFSQWQQTKHAKAFDSLKPEEKKDDTCLRCHTTGGNADMPGVQCEACHGAGGCLVSPFFLNPDNKKAHPDVQRKIKTESGLLTGEENCLRCHNSSCQHDKGFDFKKAFEQIKHTK